MAKTKHNPPRKKKASFIKFSDVQSSYLLEIKTRHIQERNDALKAVYRELNILEEVLMAPDSYILRDDLSGLDVLPIVSKDKNSQGS